MDSGRKLLVLYGSETGTAEEVAFRLCEFANRREFTAIPQTMNDFANAHPEWLLSLANAQYVAFVCSTTGDGEAPSNMRTFWRMLLRRSIPPSILSTLQYVLPVILSLINNSP